MKRVRLPKIDGRAFESVVGPSPDACLYGDKRCGAPDSDGIAGFCGEECWQRAGSPEPMTDEELADRGLQ